MELLTLIRKKRSGAELTREDVTRLVSGVVSHEVADYQLSALLMAICYEGLSYDETLALTKAFVASGERLDWSKLAGPVVDKHSTGGVGDKVSLLLAPWLAVVGLTLPKMSGRGLGHTGGTIDKLESIPGFRVALDPVELETVLSRVGCAVVSQSRNLVPADKIFYALRDATDTVDELGLIAASVMSKKLAAGAQYIVLDVKCGNGAFFKDLKQARSFAEVAIRLGRDMQRPVACVISDMSQPLGCAVGNAVEVAEVDAMLRGETERRDLTRLCEELGAQLLLMCGRSETADNGKGRMRDAWADGKVRERFERWIDAQGGRLEEFRSRQAADHGYRHIDVVSLADGYITKINTADLGEFARSLGAGRMKADDVIDPGVGLYCLQKRGAKLRAGEVIARVIASPHDIRTDDQLALEYLSCLSTGSTAPADLEVVLDAVTGTD